MNALLSTYEDAGVLGLGFPCNQFGHENPGRRREILHCYQYVRPGGNWTAHKSFKIFGKVAVNGNTAHELFKFLKTACPPTTENFGRMDKLYWDNMNARDITWNFERFLIDANGKPRYRIGPREAMTVVNQYVDELLNEMSEE